MTDSPPQPPIPAPPIDRQSRRHLIALMALTVGSVLLIALGALFPVLRGPSASPSGTPPPATTVASPAATGHHPPAFSIARHA